MKKLLIFILFSTSIFAQEFQRGQKLYCFGDHVRLRAMPNTSSKILREIAIGEPLIFLGETNKTMNYNGVKATWCEIESKGKRGYVLNSLITSLRAKINNDVYLSAPKDEKTIAIRLLTNGEIKELFIERNGDDFDIKAYDNRGLKNVKHMVFVDLAEACGYQGGGDYVFFDGENLIKAIELSQVGDGGYYVMETLLFPTDKQGRSGYLIYGYESGGPVDGNHDENLAIKFEKALKWEGKELKIKLPKIVKNWEMP